MIVGPTGTWTDDGRAVVKERLTSEPVSDAYKLPRTIATDVSSVRITGGITIIQLPHKNEQPAVTVTRIRLIDPPASPD